MTAVLLVRCSYLARNIFAGGDFEANGGGKIYAGDMTLVLNNTTVRDDVGYQICGNNIPCN